MVGLNHVRVDDGSLRSQVFFFFFSFFFLGGGGFVVVLAV